MRALNATDSTVNVAAAAKVMLSGGSSANKFKLFSDSFISIQLEKVTNKKKIYGKSERKQLVLAWHRTIFGLFKFF
jgi:hypothetical protein